MLMPFELIEGHDEERFAAAVDDGVDEELVLVDEVGR
jgi:hypothetical protein